MMNILCAVKNLTNYNLVFNVYNIRFVSDRWPKAGTMSNDFYLRYYVGHKGKFGHEFLEFEFRPDGKLR